ncbi:hypothetical protein ABT282_08620 [Streptomyces sp. NPDC000927]|uniref:hypothetical protein n=1 Tax=Streptomyces sp. NPDC000927 TaxID=3154371 RepID=UPI003330583C
MAVEMYLTDFRNDLAAIIDRLDETGPVRLLRNSKTVAEIRSATHEGDRQYTKQILDTFGYLEGLGENPEPGFIHQLASIGIDTLAALEELACRHKELTESGVGFDGYPEHCLPNEGPIAVDEALARLYFGDDYPDSVDDPYAWFIACARLQTEAGQRDMDTQLPAPNAYDEGGMSFVELAISSGHTPDTLVEFAIQALDQGVQLERLADMLGSEPVPADVLAMNSYSDYEFEQLTGNGLPHAEAIAVFRMGINTSDAYDLAEAGIREAKEIWQLLSDKINVRLVVRAARDGLTPEEWKVQVPKIQHLKYRGPARAFGRDTEGVLPFRMLVQAVEEGVSLVRWDTNSMPVEEDRRNNYVTVEQRQAMHPWVHIYPDHVIDVARAGISPSYITAFSKLMSHHFTACSSSEEFVTTAIQAHAKGLTASMANAMSRSDSKRPKFSPRQLLEVLEEGLSGTGIAHYLAGRYANPDQWILHLRERHERQLVTDTFVATVENTEVWGVVKDAALSIKREMSNRYGRLRYETYLKFIVEKFLAGKSLDDYEVMALISWTRIVAFDKGSYYMPEGWVEENGKHKEAVIQLSENFDRMRKGLSVA